MLLLQYWNKKILTPFRRAGLMPFTLRSPWYLMFLIFVVLWPLLRPTQISYRGAMVVSVKM